MREAAWYRYLVGGAHRYHSGEYQARSALLALEVIEDHLIKLGLGVTCNLEEWFPYSLLQPPRPNVRYATEYEEFCPVYSNGDMVAIIMRKPIGHE